MSTTEAVATAEWEKVGPALSEISDRSVNVPRSLDLGG